MSKHRGNRLIAAAPELLDMVRRLLELTGEPCGDVDCGNHYCLMGREALALIKRIEEG